VREFRRLRIFEKECYLTRNSEKLEKMAGIISRSSITVCRSLCKRPSIVATTTRTKSEKFTADPMEHATGLERKQLEAIARGNPDPFDSACMKRGPGTKDKPNVVASFYDKRIVGCICHEDAFYIQYMWLHKDEMKRCQCGYWFKLVDAEDPFKDIPDFHVNWDVK